EDSSWLPGTRGKAFKMVSIRYRPPRAFHHQRRTGAWKRGNEGNFIVCQHNGVRSAGYAAAAILQKGLAGAAIADVSQSCTPLFDDLLKACLSVHYLEKILRSSTLSLEEAKAGRLAVPRSNRLSICPTVLNG